MIPLNLAGPDLPIIIVIGLIILLFSGNKLSGLGRNAGKSIREFKEETRGLNTEERDAAGARAAEPETSAGSGEVAGESAPSEATSPDQPHHVS